MSDLHNLDPNRPNLCSGLRSKDMFIWVERPNGDSGEHRRLLVSLYADPART
jgi:hypothetical protein